MNTLTTTYVGGMPLYMDDLKFIQDANIEILNAIALGFNLSGQASFRVQGASWTIAGSGGASPVLTVYNGYIFVISGTDKGVYKVEDATINLPNGADETFVAANYFWDKQTTYVQPEGTKLFLDGNTHDVYKVEKAVFTTTPTTWTGIRQLESLQDQITYQAYVPTLQTMVLNIGDWNMRTTGSIAVNHGLDVSKIRNISVLVRADSDATIYTNYTFPIPMFTGGAISSPVCDAFIYSATSTSVILSLNTSITHFFDNDDFNQTSYNRGWITIQYTA